MLIKLSEELLLNNVHVSLYSCLMKNKRELSTELSGAKVLEDYA